MKKTFTKLLAGAALLLSASLSAQLTPEVLYYNFNGSGTNVPNLASAPPVGTTTATIQGTVTQGGSGTLCEGALIGSGISSTTDYLNTGWVTSITSSSAWTISFRTANFGSSSTLFYIFGDASASSFRCFTNGVAGPNNWILRGTGLTDVLANGAAITTPTMTTFVYDPALANIKAYVNGVLVNTVAQGAFTLNGTGPFKVMGYSANIGAPAGGLMDEFRLYSRALTAAEVAQLYNPMTPGILGPDQTACSSLPATFSLNVPFTSLLWSTGATTSSISTTTSGQYILTASGACASGADTVNVIAGNVTTSSISPASCGSYLSPDGNTYTTSGVYTDTIANSTGCDSIITINLTVNSPSTSAISPSVCAASYTAPSGAVYTSSGMYMDTIPNAAGCDSVITINLTINQPSAATVSPVVCGSYTSPGGMSYTASGMYMDTIPNAAGCDSVITINLTVNQPSAATVTASTCTGSYTAPSGAIYTSSGMYMDTIPNAAGCDSVITLNLTIGNTTTSTITASACGSFLSPGGNQYTQSGTYTDTIPNANGCDSVITINLTVNAIPTVTFAFTTTTICFDDAAIQCPPGIPVGGTYSGPGISGSLFTPATAGNGTHSVTYTYIDPNTGCSNSASSSITVDPCSGVNEVIEHSFNVFPNPSAGTFNVVSASDAAVLVVRLFDINGREVFSTQLNNVAAGTPVAVNAGELSAGIYSMQLSSNESSASVRVVITK
ncbi:MAG: T9SS type A sorting domain-containing protein [Bacteroidetes bacterium]|nr:T9SS type A sorting domain-containing protein [Bacteroidota bacterium]